jgi:hypothetical protein
MSVELRKPTLIESIALGGASCVFTVNFTHPIETVKTRMQVSGDGLSVVVKNTLRNEGVTGFYKGIAWAWGREGSYASIKLGGYAPVRDALGAGGADGECRLLRGESLTVYSTHLNHFISLLCQLPSISSFSREL